MPRITLVFAGLLILLGLIGYIGDSSSEVPAADRDQDVISQQATGENPAPKSNRSVTALIPSFTGFLLLIFGAVGLNARWRMHAMHGAVLVGLVGFAAAAGRGASSLVKLGASDADVNARGLLFVCLMAILCGVYTVICVSSFIQARRRKRRDPVRAA